MAAAIELGLKPGRIHGCGCGCINLLQNYPEGCFANCSYCGLARERPGLAEENSFIRVDWPLFSTDLIAEKIAEKEAESSVGRVCISQVQDHRANDDLIGITRKVHTAAPEVPLSGLVNATTMTVPFLEQLKEEGIDIIGYGLDAVTEELFIKTRGKEASGPHDWDYHWEMVRAARKIYGPLNVNCHLIVGLGETDQDMVNMFYKLKAEEIAGYLFSFNPEPGTTLQDQTRQPIQRHRRVQLAKYLIEEKDAERDVFQFDENGFITSIESEEELIQDTIDEGFPFMTNGCPDREGVMACNRPYGSYRPGEEFRDYPFKPTGDELNLIREQMQLNGELRAG
jgi:biotin synthase